MLNVPVHRVYDSMNRRLALSLISVFAISLLDHLPVPLECRVCQRMVAPVTPGTKPMMVKNQQDWVVGVYEFDLVDTSTIQMEMSWALREYNRSVLKHPRRGCGTCC